MCVKRGGEALFQVFFLPTPTSSPNPTPTRLPIFTPHPTQWSGLAPPQTSRASPVGSLVSDAPGQPGLSPATHCLLALHRVTGGLCLLPFMDSSPPSPTLLDTWSTRATELGNSPGVVSLVASGLSWCPGAPATLGGGRFLGKSQPVDFPAPSLP